MRYEFDSVLGKNATQGEWGRAALADLRGEAAPVAGWVVRVRFCRASGPPIEEFYWAAIADKKDAEEQVQDAVQAGPGDQIEVHRPLTAGELAFRGLKRGEIRRES